MHLTFFLLYKHNVDEDKEAESNLSNVIRKDLGIRVYACQSVALNYSGCCSCHSFMEANDQKAIHGIIIQLPFPKIFPMFVALVLTCGITHTVMSMEDYSKISQRKLQSHLQILKQMLITKNLFRCCVCLQKHKFF